MKPAPFDYARARTIDEAVAFLSEGNTRLLAGGQSLGPMLNLRLARPPRLVDIKRTEGLRDVAADDTTLSIGAAITHAEIEDGAIPDPTNGLLRHVAQGLAYRAVRNRGTLGGSLAHADPAADWVSTMAGLGTSIVARGPNQRVRRIPADQFLRGAFTTALGADEILVAVKIPRLSPQARWGYVKLCRKLGEFAQAIGIAILDPTRNIVRVLAGAVEGAPVLLPRVAEALQNKGPHAAIKALADETLPHLHAVAVKRAILQLTE